eukprot:762586-Hanusia_phi.AAC.2
MITSPSLTTFDRHTAPPSPGGSAVRLAQARHHTLSDGLDDRAAHGVIVIGGLEHNSDACERTNEEGRGPRISSPPGGSAACARALVTSRSHVHREADHHLGRELSLPPLSDAAGQLLQPSVSVQQ